VHLQLWLLPQRRRGRQRRAVGQAGADLGAAVAARLPRRRDRGAQRRVVDAAAEDA